MTGIKPTVSLFRVWQRELDGVLAHFSTTYTLYYYGYALTLPWSSCYSRHVTHCDSDMWHDHLWPSIIPLWHCDKVTWYFPMLHLIVVNKKRKEKKRNINNNLANLPSYDIRLWHNSMKKYYVTVTDSQRVWQQSQNGHVTITSHGSQVTVTTCGKEVSWQVV